MGACVGVVVVHFKNWGLTQRCMASVEASTHKNVHVEVIDNDKINRGFAGGANVGIRAVLQDPKVKYILVLNNDAWLEAEALSEMVKTAEETEVDMVAPVVRRASDKRVESMGIKLNSSWLGFNRANSRDGELLCPSGCAALYSRQLIEGIAKGGQFFDEDFFMYGEDTDVGLRARALGYHCAVAERAKIFHEGLASSPDSSLPMYFGHRNNVWYIAKNVRLKHFLQWPAILAWQIVSLFWLTLRGDGKIIWKAKYDAVKGLPKMWRKRERKFSDTES